MSVRRKQFSSHPRSDDDGARSSSAGSQSATSAPGRSSSWSVTPPTYTAAATPVTVRRKPHHRTAEEAARIEAAVRALRRRSLTELIHKRFHAWLALVHTRREASTARRRRLATHCVHVVQSHSPHVLASLYFRKLMWWRSYRRRRQHQHRALLSIRRSALKLLVFRHFSAWCTFCTLSRQRQLARNLLRRTTTSLIKAAWRRWTTFQVKRRRMAATVQPGLVKIQQQCAQVRTLQILRRWQGLTLRSALVQHLVKVNAERRLSYWFRCWMRRRFWSSQLLETQRCTRRNLRLLAKHRLRQWMRWAVMKGVASLLEQRSFKVLALAYIGKWRRLTQCTAQVSHLRERVNEWRLRRYFLVWAAWIRRGIRAVLLEQRHFVCLLQRYYIEWRLHIETRRLSYQSMRSFSHTLLRHHDEGAALRSASGGVARGESIF